MTGSRVPLEAGSVARRRDDVMVESLDGELVVFDERAGAVHVLNATASVVWRGLDGRATLATLAATLADAYGVDVDVVVGHVLAVARRLADDGLLVGFEPHGEGATGDEPSRLLSPPPS